MKNSITNSRKSTNSSKLIEITTNRTKIPLQQIDNCSRDRTQIRPATAKLDCPRLLDPIWMNYDMSQTRLQFDPAPTILGSHDNIKKRCMITRAPDFTGNLLQSFFRKLDGSVNPDLKNEEQEVNHLPLQNSCATSQCQEQGSSCSDVFRNEAPQNMHQPKMNLLQSVQNFCYRVEIESHQITSPNPSIPIKLDSSCCCVSFFGNKVAPKGESVVIPNPKNVSQKLETSQVSDFQKPIASDTICNKTAHPSSDSQTNDNLKIKKSPTDTPIEKKNNTQQKKSEALQYLSLDNHSHAEENFVISRKSPKPVQDVQNITPKLQTCFNLSDNITTPTVKHAVKVLQLDENDTSILQPQNKERPFRNENTLENVPQPESHLKGVDESKFIPSFLRRECNLLPRPRPKQLSLDAESSLTLIPLQESHSKNKVSNKQDPYIGSSQSPLRKVAIGAEDTNLESPSSDDQAFSSSSMETVIERESTNSSLPPLTNKMTFSTEYKTSNTLAFSKVQVSTEPLPKLRSKAVKKYVGKEMKSKRRGPDKLKFVKSLVHSLNRLHRLPANKFEFDPNLDKDDLQLPEKQEAATSFTKGIVTDTLPNLFKPHSDGSLLTNRPVTAHNSVSDSHKIKSSSRERTPAYQPSTIAPISTSGQSGSSSNHTLNCQQTNSHPQPRTLCKSAIGTQTPCREQRLLTPTQLRRQLSSAVVKNSDNIHIAGTIPRKATASSSTLPLVPTPLESNFTQTSPKKHYKRVNPKPEKVPRVKELVLGSKSTDNELQDCSKDDKEISFLNVKQQSLIEIAVEHPEPMPGSVAQPPHPETGINNLQHSLKLKKVRVSSSREGDQIRLSYRRRMKVCDEKIPPPPSSPYLCGTSNPQPELYSNIAATYVDSGRATPFSKIVLLPPKSPQENQEFIDLSIVVRRPNNQTHTHPALERHSSLNPGQYYLFIDLDDETTIPNNGPNVVSSDSQITSEIPDNRPNSSNTTNVSDYNVGVDSSPPPQICPTFQRNYRVNQYNSFIRI